MGSLSSSRTAETSRHYRVLALVIVIAMHLALILILLAVRGALPPAITTGGALSVVSLQSAEPATSRPPPPTLPGKIVAQVVPLTSFIYSDTPDSYARLTALGGCATLETIVQSLLADQRAVAAVRSAPPEARSIADAVVIWNAGWSEAALAVESPLAPARASVELSLSLISDHCLDEPIAGPRLVPIPAGQGTMFLVFGSGNWTWRELIEPQPPTTETMAVGLGSTLEETLRRLFRN